LCKVTSSSWLEYIYIFSGFNFTAAQVVCTTALINHAFITDFIERKEKKKENRERKKMVARNPGGEKRTFHAAIFSSRFIYGLARRTKRKRDYL